VQVDVSCGARRYVKSVVGRRAVWRRGWM
jgi:hypothetical protein